MELADYILSMFLFLICIHCIYLYYFLSIILYTNTINNQETIMYPDAFVNNITSIIISNSTSNNTFIRY